MIIQKVCMWGNSLGVRLPQAITKQIKLEEGELINISVQDNKIILSPTKPKYNLEELLSNANPETQHDELDWGESVGEETW